MSSRRRKRASRRIPAITWVIAVALVLAISGLAWFKLTPAPRKAQVKIPAAASALGTRTTRSRPNTAPSLAAASAAPLPTSGELAKNHVRVCGNTKLLGGGPVSKPKGAIRVWAGDDGRINFRLPHRTYWFAPGVHTLGRGIYTQIIPGNGSTFIGAPGAVLDGEHENYYAFTGNATKVTISYLTIMDFGTKGGNFDQGVVNTSSGTSWTIDHSTIEDNAGAGVMIGSRNLLAYDCLADNQQYGFNAYSPSGPESVVMVHNEIAGNDTYNWEAHQAGCGCTGGGKFWRVRNARVMFNWIHGNHNVGLWADTDNRGFNIQDNYFEGNYGEGLIYEISYNGLVDNNLFVRNGLGAGPKNPGFPIPAIYISESGSDSRVAGNYGKTFSISGNTFVNNWSGVILWENSNRFCGSPDNSSAGICTLVDPAVANIKTCTQAHLTNANPRQVPDYYDLCRWKTQNITVGGNVFDFNRAEIGPSCTAANGCGYMGLFSEWGTTPSWSPFQKTVVENHITFDQNNHFLNNVYNGPWLFMAHSLGVPVSWSGWRKRYHQDAGSGLYPDANPATFP